MEMKDIFKVVNFAEKGYYTIVVGDRIATDKKFATEEEAKKYSENVNWDLVGTLLITVVDYMKRDIINELKK